MKKFTIRDLSIRYSDENESLRKINKIGRAHV